MPMLDWRHKDEATKAVAKTALKILRERRDLGAGDRANLLVQGDNLEALKALLPFAAGTVKCIYIDPPYNTGSAFEHYDDNVEHATWLSMMYPRLELLRDFLAEDGSIWISIDDREGAYLRVICDEIFGRGNFIADVAWEKSDSPRMDAKLFSTRYDHTLVFAKNIATVKINKVQVDEVRLYYKIFADANSSRPPETLWSFSFAGSNRNSKSEQAALFGTEIAFDTPKPELLLKRILEVATNPGDLVMDSFLGSGTTAAVAQKMGRRWIGIEMGEHAKTHCRVRLQKVVDGEAGGISKAVNWTGGGKTILAAHAVKLIAETQGRAYPLVLWFAPSDTIRRQTADALKKPSHPYRQALDAAFGGHVRVFDLDQKFDIRPADIAQNACVVVATEQAFVKKNTEKYKVYADHEALEPHFAGVSLEPGLEAREDEPTKPKTSFANLVLHHRAIVIVDEAHKMTSELSRETLARLRPSAVLGLSATPERGNNTVYSVWAKELPEGVTLEVRADGSGAIRICENLSAEDQAHVVRALVKAGCGEKAAEFVRKQDPAHCLYATVYRESLSGLDVQGQLDALFAG